MAGERGAPPAIQGATPDGASPLDRVVEDRAVLDRLRCLDGRRYTVAPLPGGLTNRNLRVVTESEILVVRISHPDGALLGIDRDAEYHNSSTASQTGVGAPVVEYRPDLFALVVGFIEARTCSSGDLEDPACLGRIVAACRRLHGGRRFGNDFDMLRLHAHLLEVVQHRGYRLPAGYLEIVPELGRIEAVLAATSGPTVPCHNDLLPENCLDDGARAWLIDYEYAGNNDPCFELGNLWSESGLGIDHLEHIVACYFGEPDRRRQARVRLQAIVSKCGWTLWACVQDSAAPLDFDFWSWGMERYDRAAAEVTSSEFGRLLDAVGGL
jgi:thiamine kinase-like enzyme